ncbi:MAG: hypothetical protein JWL95_2672 [Gemmatimonadetes bacterium]|nr:hypothetical protein [Gemmatimonadota bacterium]
MSGSVEGRVPSAVPESQDPGPRRARMAEYGLWQLRDYLMDRGTPTFIVATLFGYLTLMPMLATRSAEVPARLIARFGSESAARAAMLAQLNYGFLRSFLGTLIFVGALFAMNGIVANDRKLGFYRFLFAKPVTPARYYGQAFVIHWASFVGLMTLAGLLYGVFVAPVLSWPLMTVVALMFLCYGGIAFLLSAAARWDWLSLVAVSVASTFLWGKFGASGHPLAKLLYLLPPLHRTDEVYAAVSGAQLFDTSAPHLPWHLVAWLASYGAASFLAGLLVLRHRRLAIV